MTEKNAFILLEQIRNIMLKKPVEEKLEVNEPVIKELQNTLSYLSHCLIETSEYIENLAKGKTDTIPPGQSNFLSGDLKKLHSTFKHLTENSNIPIANSKPKRKSLDTLLLSILDSLKDWVVVTEEETGDILYVNELAKRRFFDPECRILVRKEITAFMEKLKSTKNIQEELRYEYKCTNHKIFKVKSYSLLWEDTRAVVHLITDVTYQRETEAYLEIMAYKDELTGLNNRRSCFQTIETFIQDGGSFALCMIDLDGLKFVNDRFGHLYGDEYLKMVSQELENETGEKDFTCRFGGDEFIVLFHDCDKKTALEKLARVDQRVSESEMNYPMSISYGVVCVTREMHLPPEYALKLADEDMYCFKRRRKEKIRIQGKV
ncbi:GGDEF domain-containing protein [Clostridium sp. E02]|uniref:GGDEF domain-containing protein n=1 Tax=Clostridium sp. E02 TaxID=2487134 RepID=UPI000F52628C|nr:GGDEF domain-containing protein [Clostridium sp. E02]